MGGISELIPELKLWNEGAGIGLDDWIYIEGRADHALGFCHLMWPEFVEFEDYVIRAPLELDRLRGWESVADIDRQQVEIAMNVLLLDDIFPNDKADSALKFSQCRKLATIMADMLDAKLSRDFPHRCFTPFVIDGDPMAGDEFGISFHQT